MTKFRFWATIVLAFVLGFVGYVLAGILPLPNPLNVSQTRALLAILGILIGLLSFARLATWAVRTASRLSRQIMHRLATEIINQFTQLTTRGWSLIPGIHSEADSGLKWLNRNGAIVVDTSSLIDGRVLDVVKSGFLSGALLIPNFVLQELQQVADSADGLKRSRGRRGFEIVNQLKKIRGVRVVVGDRELIGKTVDDKIIRLTKITQGRVLTCDYNLAQVAKLSALPVLNINDLANALKTLPIPGEKINIRISQVGKDHSQGVGYLPDGTMAVIKGGASRLNKSVSVEVTKILQGPAGRMIFGKIVEV